MNRQLSFQQAINEALAQEMERDKTVILMGEDIAGGSGTQGQMDAWGGPLGITKGLWSRFGDRVMDTPISESAIVGLGNGLALSGMIPVCEIMFGDFLTLAADQLINHASKFAYMYNNKVQLRLIVRTPMGGKRGYGPTRSRRALRPEPSRPRR